MTSPPPYDLKHGDAIDLLRLLEPDSYGAVVTDPPYSSGGQYRGDRARPTREKYVQSGASLDMSDFDGDTRDQRTFTMWSTEWMRHALTATRTGGVAAVFTDWRQLAATTDAMQIAGWVYRGLITWNKSQGRPNPGLQGSHAEYIVIGTNGTAWWSELEAPPYVAPVVTCPAPPSGERWHMTEKPLAVMTHLMRLVPPGEPVLDPFSGSGTTLIAAAAAGHHATGFEVNRTQHAVATQRLATQAAPIPLFEDTVEATE